MRHWALLLLSVMTPVLVRADETPSVQAEVSPTTAKLGDVLTMTITVRHPSGVFIDPPAFQKMLNTFEVRASTQLPTELEGTLQIKRFQAELQNFATGPQLLPGLVLPYKDVLGKPHQIKTPELKVTIEPIPPGPKDKGDIRGIKGVYGPVAKSPFWWIIPILLLIAGGLYAWRRRQQAIAGPPPPPPVPADQVALQKLEELKALGWAESGKIKEFYSAVSDILRTYLEAGFKIPALERTTSELMRDVRKNEAFDARRYAALKELLEECDLVKFAKFRPEPAEALQVCANAVGIVEATRGAIAEPEAHALR